MGLSGSTKKAFLLAFLIISTASSAIAQDPWGTPCPVSRGNDDSKGAFDFDPNDPCFAQACSYEEEGKIFSAKSSDPNNKNKTKKFEAMVCRTGYVVPEPGTCPKKTYFDEGSQKCEELRLDSKIDKIKTCQGNRYALPGDTVTGTAFANIEGLCRLESVTTAGGNIELPVANNSFTYQVPARKEIRSNPQFLFNLVCFEGMADVQEERYQVSTELTIPKLIASLDRPMYFDGMDVVGKVRVEPYWLSSCTTFSSMTLNAIDHQDGRSFVNTDQVYHTEMLYKGPVEKFNPHEPVATGKAYWYGYYKGDERACWGQRNRLRLDVSGVINGDKFSVESNKTAQVWFGIEGEATGIYNYAYKLFRKKVGDSYEVAMIFNNPEIVNKLGKFIIRRNHLSEGVTNYDPEKSQYAKLATAEEKYHINQLTADQPTQVSLSKFLIQKSIYALAKKSFKRLNINQIPNGFSIVTNDPEIDVLLFKWVVENAIASDAEAAIAIFKDYDVRLAFEREAKREVGLDSFPDNAIGYQCTYSIENKDTIPQALIKLERRGLL